MVRKGFWFESGRGLCTNAVWGWVQAGISVRGRSRSSLSSERLTVALKVTRTMFAKHGPHLARVRIDIAYEDAGISDAVVHGGI